MNKIYRLIWNHARQAFVVASELATSSGKRSSTVNRMGILFAGAFVAQGALAAPATNALPTGGQVVSGQATVSQSGNGMTIHQGSDKAILNWESFSIGADASVNFQQPGSDSVALNRVVGSDPSAIYGSLTANGQVFLVNPKGVLFGKGARVDVGGLVASTLDMSDADFRSGANRFTLGEGAGSVVNQGELYGKYIALLAPEVRNEGVIAARQGTVALAAGEAVTLDIAGNRLIGVQVDKADIDTLVANRHLVMAEDGTVIMSAQSANTLVGKVVNTGEVEAGGISTDGGAVRLLASSDIEHGGSIRADAVADGNGGSVTLVADLDNPESRTSVTGEISARGGSASGDGGAIETSASHLDIADSARIDTTAPMGQTGDWLLDPYDFTIASSGGDITGAALSTALASNNVTIQTSDTAASCTGASCGSGDSAGNGDIFVNDAVSWTSGRTLTLSAWRDVVVNQPIDVSANGGLTVQYDTADAVDGRFFANAPVNLAATSTFTTKEGSDPGAIVTNYTIIRDQAGLEAMTVDDPMVSYALGKNIGLTGSWTPIGDGTTYFSGRFEGLGHVIDGVNASSADGLYVGLFGAIGSTGMVKDIALTNVSVSGKQHVGALAGLNLGLVSHVTASGAVTGTTADSTKIAGIGGLIGSNESIVEFSSAEVAVTATTDTAANTYFGSGFDGGIGGLIGIQASFGYVSDSYATGSVKGIRDVGGLIGYGSGYIKNTYAAGSVRRVSYANGGANVGGLLGKGASIDGMSGGNFWDTQATGQGSSFGGIATGKTTTEMQTPATFTGAGWDTRFWALADGSYPGLRHSIPSLTTAVTLTIGYMSKTYGDANPGTLPSLSLSGCTDCISLDSWGSFLTTTTDVGSYDYSTADLLNLAYNTGSASDYTLTFSGSFEVTQRPLTLSASKVYDGTKVLTADQVSISNLANGEKLTIANAFANDAHVATAGKYISAIDLSDGTTGTIGKASNYSWTLDVDHAPVTITKRSVTYTLPNKPSKEYDGFFEMPANFDTGASISNLLPGETASSFSYSSVSFDSPDASDNRVLSFAGVGFSVSGGSYGSQFSDYRLDDFTMAAAITPRPLTLSASKVYDGTTALTASQVSIGNLALGEDLTIDNAVASDAHVATADKYISAITLSDGRFSKVSNYSWTLDAANAPVTITPRPLTLSASKVYDGTTALAASQVSIDNLVPGEALTIANAVASDAHVATAGKYIASIALSDGTTGKVSDYSWAVGSGAPVTITPRPLTYTLANTGVTKTYDGTTDAPSDFSPSWSLSSGTSLASGDTLSLTNSGAAYNDWTVSGASRLTVSGVGIGTITGSSGSQASDYQLTVSSNSVAATITRKDVTLTPPAISKPEDGTTAFSGAVDYSGLTSALGVTGDEVTDITLTFDTKEVGTNKTVTPSAAGITRSGVDVSGNYAINYRSADNGSITLAWNPGRLLTLIRDLEYMGGDEDAFFDKVLLGDQRKKYLGGFRDTISVPNQTFALMFGFYIYEIQDYLVGGNHFSNDEGKGEEIAGMFSMLLKMVCNDCKDIEHDELMKLNGVYDYVLKPKD